MIVTMANAITFVFYVGFLFFGFLLWGMIGKLLSKIMTSIFLKIIISGLLLHMLLVLMVVVLYFVDQPSVNCDEMLDAACNNFRSDYGPSLALAIYLGWLPSIFVVCVFEFFRWLSFAVCHWLSNLRDKR